MKTIISILILTCVLYGQQTNQGFGCYFQINYPGQAGMCDGLGVSRCNAAIPYGVTDLEFGVCGQPSGAALVMLSPGAPVTNNGPCLPCGCFGFVDLDLAYPGPIIVYQTTFSALAGFHCDYQVFSFPAYVTFDVTLQAVTIGDQIYYPYCGVCTTMAVHLHRP